MNQSGYSVGTGSPGAGGAAAPAVADHEKLKRDYLEYLSNKSEEIKEQQNSRRYFHGSQYTAAQIKVYNRRKQPVVTFNRVARKLNQIIGMLARQRQDPRAFPRTPDHEDGAEIATAVLRYVMDQQDWTAKSSTCGLDGAVDGLAGIEIILEPGDKSDIEVGFETIDPGSFFYDPRSLKADFSDARYMGIGKWADLDAAIEMYPDKEDLLRSSTESGSDLTSNPDSDNKWVSGSVNSRRVRIIDHWYIKGGAWHYCIYTGSVLLDEGESYLVDEKGKTFCKYIVYSANVDQDGDRYGFVRNMKSSQDEINQRRSKALHIGNTRRMIVQDGQGLDVEKLRTEGARPDGVMVYPPGTVAPIFDDARSGQELTAQLAFLQDAKTEIENYSYNPDLLGSGGSDKSGKAIELLQQAGIAELGPYIIAYRGWKLRAYRAAWNAVQRHWTAERWIRVTDDDNVAQFLAINQPATDEWGQPVIDPATGQQQLANQLGALDVDIIIDEGPDTINAQQDTNETLKQIMPAIAPMLSPALAQAALKLLISTSALPAEAKKAFNDAEKQSQQPNPQKQMADELQMRGVAAEVQDAEAGAKLKEAQAVKVMAETQQIGAAPQQAMLEQAGKVQDQQFRQQEHAANMEIKKLDVVSKVIGLEAQRQKASQPQTAQRSA